LQIAVFFMQKCRSEGVLSA